MTWLSLYDWLQWRALLFALLLIPACSGWIDRTDVRRDVLVTWPGFRDLDVAVQQDVRAASSIKRGDALLVGEYSSVTIRSECSLPRLARLVGESSDDAGYRYRLAGPAFVRFDNINGVGFDESGLRAEDVDGVVSLLPNGPVVRRFVAANGFFVSETFRERTSPATLSSLMDNLPWKPAPAGLRVTAWAALRTRANSTATLQVRLRSLHSSYEAETAPIETGEKAEVMQLAPLTTLLLTPHDRIEATIIQYKGDVEFTDDDEAVRSIFATTNVDVFKEYER